ncbi:hypothetical protein ACFPRL_12725 [Pseudoclavibacter helvolus]
MQVARDAFAFEGCAAQPRQLLHVLLRRGQLFEQLAALVSYAPGPGDRQPDAARRRDAEQLAGEDVGDLVDAVVEGRYDADPERDGDRHEDAPARAHADQPDQRVDQCLHKPGPWHKHHRHGHEQRDERYEHRALARIPDGPDAEREPHQRDEQQRSHGDKGLRALGLGLGADRDEPRNEHVRERRAHDEHVPPAPVSNQEVHHALILSRPTDINTRTPEGPSCAPDSTGT